MTQVSLLSRMAFPDKNRMFATCIHLIFTIDQFFPLYNMPVMGSRHSKHLHGISSTILLYFIATTETDLLRNNSTQLTGYRNLSTWFLVPSLTNPC